MPKVQNQISGNISKLALFLKKIKQFSSMIRLSHTLFALPFALTALVIIVKNSLTEFSWANLVFVVLAFTGARSFSMGINRIADAKIDADNPRTKNREIPAGILSISQVWIFTVISMLLTTLFAWLLTPLAFYLSFPAMILLAGYSYSKRFTWLCHLWLGAVIGMAPLGVYIALTQTLPTTSWILFGILTTYIGGFDILYSLQDIDFDRKQRLYSIPARFGVNLSLLISTALHLLSIAGFFWLGFYEALGVIYTIGAVILSILVIMEHKIIGWSNHVKLDKIPVAFFNYNSAISILFFLFILAGSFYKVPFFKDNAFMGNKPLSLKLLSVQKIDASMSGAGSQVRAESR